MKWGDGFKNGRPAKYYLRYPGEINLERMRLDTKQALKQVLHNRVAPSYLETNIQQVLITPLPSTHPQQQQITTPVDARGEPGQTRPARPLRLWRFVAGEEVKQPRHYDLPAGAAPTAKDHRVYSQGRERGGRGDG